MESRLGGCQVLQKILVGGEDVQLTPGYLGYSPGQLQGLFSGSHILLLLYLYVGDLGLAEEVLLAFAFFLLLVLLFWHYHGGGLAHLVLLRFLLDSHVECGYVAGGLPLPALGMLRVGARGVLHIGGSLREAAVVPTSSI